LKQSAGAVREGVTHGISSAKKKTTASTVKQSAGTVREGVTHGISSAKKKTTASTVKQVQKQAAKTSPDAKTTRRGVKAASAPKLQGTLNKSVSGKQQKDRVDTKSGRPRPPGRIHKQGKRSIRQLMDRHAHPASAYKSSSYDHARPGAWSTYWPTTEEKN
jgi:hypothetical protein